MKKFIFLLVLAVIPVLGQKPKQNTATPQPPPAHNSKSTSTTSNLDDTLTGWKPVCAKPSCNPGGIDSPASATQVVVASPSQDGSAMHNQLVTNATSSQTNVLWVNHASPPCDSCTDWFPDFWFYIPSNGSDASSFEFDSASFSQSENLDFMFGTQCNQGSHLWQIDNQNDPWVSTSVACNLTYGTWHHYQAHFYRIVGDTGCTYKFGAGLEGQYVDRFGKAISQQEAKTPSPCNYFDYLTIDGVKNTLNMSLRAAPLPAGWSSDTVIQFQLDIGATTGTAKTVDEYLDKVNLSASVSASPSIPSPFSGKSRWDYVALTTQSTSANTVPLMAIRNAPVSFYTNCTALPCSTHASVYSSVTSTTPCPNTAQVVRPLTNTCSSTADDQGNFGGWFTAGNYQYTITYGTTINGPYPFSVVVAGNLAVDGEINNQISGTVPLATDQTKLNATSHISEDGTSTNISQPLNVSGSIHGTIPPDQVTWPPSCTTGVYSPASNTCVPPGTAGNPAGAPTQLQYNAGSVFGAVPNSAVDASGNVTMAGIKASANNVVNVQAPPYNASGSPEILTCTATGGSASLSCPSGTGVFAAGQGIYVAHAGIQKSLATPSAPTVTNISTLTNEVATIPATGPYTVTLANAATFVQVVGINYNNIAPENLGTFFNVGLFTPGKAEYTVAPAGVVTFSSSDATKQVLFSYAYGDTSGTTTHTYQVAQIDTLGGQSTASAVTTTTTSAATLSDLHRNRLSWPSLGATGYVVYRDGVLVSKVDELSSWEPRQIYRIGDVITPVGGNGHQYTAISDGLSGKAGNAPAFPTTPGGTVTEVTDGGDNAVGTLPVTWQESGVPTIVWDDLNSPQYIAANGSIKEPNLPSAPPASPLPDAFVGTVASVVGTTITMTNPAVTSATSVFTLHDDTVAIQSSINVPFQTLRAGVIYFPEGYYRLSSSLTIPANTQGNYSFLADAPVTNNFNNQPYGGSFWHLNTATSITPGGGSILTATCAYPRMMDFSTVTSGGGPRVQNLTFLGYGVGHQSGMDNQLTTTGLLSATFSFVRFENPKFYNLWIGLRMSMQWSSLTSPVFRGNHISMTYPGATTNLVQNNQIDMYSPQISGSYIGLLIRGGSINSYGGSRECDATDALVSGGLGLTAFQTERCYGDTLMAHPSIDAMTCDGCAFNGGAGGTVLANRSVQPGVVVRGGRRVTFRNWATAAGGMHIGVTGAGLTIAGVQLETTMISGGFSPLTGSVFVAANATIGGMLMMNNDPYVPPVFNAGGATKVISIDPYTGAIKANSFNGLIPTGNPVLYTAANWVWGGGTAGAVDLTSPIGYSTVVGVGQQLNKASGILDVTSLFTLPQIQTQGDTLVTVQTGATLNPTDILNGTITNVQTSITVTNGSISGYPANGYLLIDQELMQYVGTPTVGTITYTVARGLNGTQPQAHNNGATVTLVSHGTFDITCNAITYKVPVVQEPTWTTWSGQVPLQNCNGYAVTNRWSTDTIPQAQSKVSYIMLSPAASVVKTCGTTTTCSNLSQAPPRTLWGTVPLTGGTVTVTGMAAWTATTSYGCTCTDTATTPAACSVQNTSTSSITIKGTGTDVITYHCIGN